MTKGLIGLGALVAVILGGAAIAEGMGPHGRGAMMQKMISSRIARMEDAIQATPEQRDQIEKSKQVILDALAARHQDGKTDHANLIEALTADQLDTGKLYSLAEQRKSDIDALAPVIIGEIKKVHDILTHEQRQILAAKAKELQQRHQQSQGGTDQ